MAVTVKTDSGLCIGPWVRRGIIPKERRQLVRGFFFKDLNGKR